MSNQLDLICLSHLRWGFVFQRPNHLMSRAARERRVFFFEEPIFDSEQPRLAVSQAADNLYVTVPHLPPGLSAEAAPEQQRKLLNELCSSFDIESPIAWYYTPMALEYADLPASLVVYDCMDELSAFHGAPPRLRELEDELFRRAHLVFTGGESLYQAKKSRHPSVHAFPSSVDFAHFSRGRQALPEPADQAGIGYPRIGFFGVIDERMDLELIEDVAKKHPEWHLIMLGPVVKIDPATLPRLPNIHWLGQKSYEELPRYLSGWHAAMMPFALNESTRFISPTKTLEYLAAGRPVISTPIHDVVHPYGERGLVRIAPPDRFDIAIEDALSESPSRRRAAVDEFLASTSWDTTWERMRTLIDERLRAPSSKVA
jgi:glycosyltransferase involved in cell wall biosynthesis